MNRIEELFKKKNKNVLSVYMTAGYPSLNDTAMIIEELEKSGADMIEIGIPFSDPLADGLIIQHSSEEALKNGISLKKIFEQLKDIRKKVNIPLLLMGYINPVMNYGMENFCKTAHELGMDGCIIPDLPLAEYQSEYKTLFEKYNLCNIFLITPQTSEARIRQIDSISKGFIYVVSSASTTGTNMGKSDEKEKFFKRVNEMKLKTPTLIGFGISNKESFQQACKYANGGIIGSAFVKAVQNSKDIKQDIKQFTSAII